MSRRAAMLVALAQNRDETKSNGNVIAESPARSNSSVPDWFLKEVAVEKRPLLPAAAPQAQDKAKPRAKQVKRQLDFQDPTTVTSLTLPPVTPTLQIATSKEILGGPKRRCQDWVDKNFNVNTDPKPTKKQNPNDSVKKRQTRRTLVYEKDGKVPLRPTLIPVSASTHPVREGSNQQDSARDFNLVRDLTLEIPLEGKDDNATIATIPPAITIDPEVERPDLQSSVQDNNLGPVSSLSCVTLHEVTPEAIDGPAISLLAIETTEVLVRLDQNSSADTDHSLLGSALSVASPEAANLLHTSESFLVHEDHMSTFDSLLNSSNEVTLEVHPSNNNTEEGILETINGNFMDVDAETEQEIAHTVEDTLEEDQPNDTGTGDETAENFDNNNNNVTKSSRKRVAKPDTWKPNVAKKAKNSGQAYEDKTEKKLPAVVMKGPCACKTVCRNKITIEERAAVFEKFWALGDHRRQWEFIVNHVTQSKVSRKTVSEEAPSRRQHTRVYQLQRGDGQLRQSIAVCKTMFLNTLSIGAAWIDSAFTHLLSGNSFTMSPDKRGVHENRPNKITDVQKQTVRDHINTYPRMHSHYCRARTSREYLESGLNVSKMHRHYLDEWFTQSQLPEEQKATKRAYEEVFNTEFNLGFFIPKKDQCSLCNLVKFGTRPEREKYKEKYAAHLAAKKQAQNLKAASKKTAVSKPETTACLVFDFQKILQCPKSDTSTFYYLSKLSAFNFTVFNMGRQEGLCYMWHEVIAKKGADEVASMLFYHFEQLAKEGITEILSFSDSCWSQNKNRFVFGMLLMAAARFNIKIQLCFLEPGHTHNEGDSVHALIEKTTKDKHIFDFSEWMEAVRTAKVNAPMYAVKEVTQKMVYDFHTMVDLTNWEKDTEKKKIMWSKVRVVEASPDNVGILKFRYDFNGPTFSLDIKQRRGHPINLLTYKLPQKYTGKIPLRGLKIKHLRQLCKSLAIPSKYHQFYEDLFNRADPVENDEEADPQADEDCAEARDEDLDRYMERERGRRKETNNSDQNDNNEEDDPETIDDDNE